MTTEDMDKRFMSYLTLYENMSGDIIWQVAPGGYIWREYHGPKFTIHLRGKRGANKAEMNYKIKKHIRNSDTLGKYVKESNGAFYVDTDLIRSDFPDLFVHSWISGKVIAKLTFPIRYEAEAFVPNSPEIPSVSADLVIDREAIVMSQPRKIFLSHKGINKPLVREYFHTLKLIGLDPWLDEDAMSAGVELDRAIKKGMEDSVAAVFFITPEYVDKDFLSDEINHAILQRRKTKNFKIIALLIRDSKGKTGVVPTLLENYVYKTISKSEQLLGLREIIKSLNLEFIINYLDD